MSWVGESRAWNVPYARRLRLAQAIHLECGFNDYGLWGLFFPCHGEPEPMNACWIDGLTFDTSCGTVAVHQSSPESLRLLCIHTVRNSFGPVTQLPSKGRDIETRYSIPLAISRWKSGYLFKWHELWAACLCNVAVKLSHHQGAPRPKINDPLEFRPSKSACSSVTIVNPHKCGMASDSYIIRANSRDPPT